MQRSGLKRYLPRGIYGRSALILLFPVIALQLIVSSVFIQRHYDRVTRAMAANVAIDFQFIIDEINAAPDLNTAQRVSEQLGDRFDYEVMLTSVNFTPQPADLFDFSGRALTQEFRQDLPAFTAISLPDHRQGAVQLESAYGPVQIDFARTKTGARNPHQLILIMMLAGALTTLIALIFLRNQLRPIRRLARAAEAYGRNQLVTYTPSGALEVRAAGEAFLDMRDKIEQQTQARTMMLSGISHDLRTPLTRMRLALSMMDEADAAPMIRDVNDMERLVNAFLEFGRDRLADAREPVSAAAFLRVVVQPYIEAGDAVALTISQKVAETDQVLLNPGLMQRALDNLIANGLRYGDQVRVALEAPDRRTLAFIVEDNGPGIPPERRELAKQPFSRLDPSRNQDKGLGVGLGLAIVDDIARSHATLLTLHDSAALGGLKAVITLNKTKAA